ncbi:hypothetical protein PUNSTDRAFT_49616 [Punctularia strigosozonata HHB-11173 SS5]|uniref:uncharacterized protein n=1 Tax=Punctularia strigosozonata (strain HHB-11173) TaxID=741275 RepID=UPI0004416BD7|nr:uncharacterized protein PUNSTDRAFT_49616 [Punctularia strigosozonata HHB-11173 SS5]EIN12376.1 hypothetical protein PUNSTDRAFT_49616 [Punctularia strigosozonata HHB-11173 SS5]
MNNNVRTALTTAIVSGAFSPSDLSKLAGSSPDSVSVISSLSPAGQSIIRGAYRVGIEWCFYSMVPWYGLSFITTLLLGKVREDTRMEKKDEKVGETIDMQERGTRPIGDGSSKGGNIAQSKA